MARMLLLAFVGCCVRLAWTKSAQKAGKAASDEMQCVFKETESHHLGSQLLQVGVQGLPRTAALTLEDQEERKRDAAILGGVLGGLQVFGTVANTVANDERTPDSDMKQMAQAVAGAWKAVAGLDGSDSNQSDDAIGVTYEDLLGDVAGDYMPGWMPKTEEELAVEALLDSSRARPTGYDEALARKSVLLSSISYCPKDSIDRWNQSFQNPVCNNLTAMLHGSYENASSTGSGFIVVDHEQRAVIATFKGTNSTSDYFTNLAFINRPCVVKNVTLPGQVHQGFCNYYLSLVDEGMDVAIADALADAQKTGDKFDLIFTGHSLGGAAAAIASLDAKHRMKVEANRTLLYTFGEPRTGNADFASNLSTVLNNTYRIVNGKDFVPHLPPSCPENATGDECPFHHAQEIWYPKGMADYNAAFAICNDMGEDLNCSSRSLAADPFVDMMMRLSHVQDHVYYFGMSLPSFCCYDVETKK